MREYGPEEPLQGGWEPENRTFQFGKVTAVDEDARAITVKFTTSGGGTNNIALVAIPGDHSLPLVGDRVLIAVDFAERYFSLGIIETVYKAKIKDQIWPKVKAGEVCHIERNCGSKLYFDKEKNISLDNILGDGLRVDTQQQETSLTGNTLKFIANAGSIIYGAVKRQVSFLSGPEVITDSGTVLKELNIEITNALGRLAKLILGDVVDDDGDKMKLGANDLRAWLQICGLLGNEVGSIKIDSGGNIELNFNGTKKLTGTGKIQLDSDVVLGGETGTHAAVLGDNLTTYLTALETTLKAAFPPILVTTPAIGASLLSTKVNISQ